MTGGLDGNPATNQVLGLGGRCTLPVARQGTIKGTEPHANSPKTFKPMHTHESSL